MNPKRFKKFHTTVSRSQVSFNVHKKEKELKYHNLPPREPRYPPDKMNKQFSYLQNYILNAGLAAPLSVAVLKSLYLLFIPVTHSLVHAAKITVLHCLI